MTEPFNEEERNPKVPHEVREDGTWACAILGMKAVREKTTLKGFAACGHCISYLKDKDGNKIAYTLRDLVLDVMHKMDAEKKSSL